MTGDPAATREVNPLLFIVFCPHCVLSGIFGLAATGTVTLPSVLGVDPVGYLAPLLAFGTLFAWLAWGYISKRGSASTRVGGPCRSSCRFRA